MKKKLRWGIVSTGWMARRFLEDFVKVRDPDISVAAVASRDIKNAQSVIKDFNLTGAVAYGSYEELYKDPEVDIVYVASPHSLHKENTLSALRAGKPVLCEKPFALNLKQAEEMISCARGRKLFLMDALWSAFLPVLREVKKQVANGVIGEIKRVVADFSIELPYKPGNWMYDRQMAGGSLMNLGIYSAFLASWLFEEEPLEVKAHACFGETGVDLQTSALLKYSGERQAIVSSSCVFNSTNTARLEGTGGSIVIPAFWMTDTATIMVNGKKTRTIKIPWGYTFEIEAVNRSLRDGATECEEMPLDFTLKLMRLLDRIRTEAGIVFPGDL